MKRNPRDVSVILMIPLLLLAVLLAPCHADEIIIIGEINDTQQLVDSKEYQVYEIDDNEVGNKLVTENISAKVKVWGNLRVKDGIRIITVTRFKVVSD